jgi:hypothetical protein
MGSSPPIRFGNSGRIFSSRNSQCRDSPKTRQLTRGAVLVAEARRALEKPCDKPSARFGVFRMAQEIAWRLCRGNQLSVGRSLRCRFRKSGSGPSGIQPAPPDAARIIASMPALITAGSDAQAAITAFRSASTGSAIMFLHWLVQTPVQTDASSFASPSLLVLAFAGRLIVDLGVAGSGPGQPSHGRRRTKPWRQGRRSFAPHGPHGFPRLKVRVNVSPSLIFWPLSRQSLGKVGGSGKT